MVPPRSRIPCHDVVVDVEGDSLIKRTGYHKKHNLSFTVRLLISLLHNTEQRINVLQAADKSLHVRLESLIVVLMVVFECSEHIRVDAQSHDETMRKLPFPPTQPDRIVAHLPGFDFESFCRNESHTNG